MLAGRKPTAAALSLYPLTPTACRQFYPPTVPFSGIDHLNKQAALPFRWPQVRHKVAPAARASASTVIWGTQRLAGTLLVLRKPSQTGRRVDVPIGAVSACRAVKLPLFQGEPLSSGPAAAAQLGTGEEAVRPRDDAANPLAL